jgi:hypothetical protein
MAIQTAQLTGNSGVSNTVLDLSRAIPAQAQTALADGSAKMLGESFLASRPPVANADRFPHFRVPSFGDVLTTAYVIRGKVYAKQHHASGGFDVWFDCGKAPTAPAL